MAAYTSGHDAYGNGSGSDDYEKRPYEYEYGASSPPIPNITGAADPTDTGHSLHRGLSARQVSMIAIGGAIGYASQQRRLMRSASTDVVILELD